MNFLKIGASLVCMLFLVAACATDQTQTDVTELSKKTAKSEEPLAEKIPNAARTVEEMIEQKAGVLVEMHMDQQLETLGGWDGQKYLDFLEQTFNPIAEEELKTYFTNHKNL